MKSVAVFKFLTFFLGLALLAGFALLGFIISERLPKSKMQMAPAAESAPRFTGEVRQMSACGAFLCLLLERGVETELLILNPKDISSPQRLIFKKMKKDAGH